MAAPVAQPLSAEEGPAGGAAEPTPPHHADGNARSDEAGSDQAGGDQAGGDQAGSAGAKPWRHRLAAALPWRGRGWRRVDPVAACVIVATAIFALGGIGTPLLGLKVFADPGSLAQYSAYRDVLAGVQLQAENQRDITDNVLPMAQLFHDSLWQGDFAAWNPYSLGGEALGSVPNSGLSSPLSLPYWLLPTWLAPAYVKLLELICAVGGMVLFLRRLKLSRASAWLGALVFASSAFMVVWTNWPQTRVAAIIPALFWSLERLAQRVRVREVALVGLTVAAMLLGGFPAVTGYALVTAACYLLVRVIAQHGRDIRANVGKLAAAAGGVAAGVGLAAFQLVPWAAFMQTVFIEGRAQDDTQHLPVEALITAVAPFALGTANPAHPPTWYGGLEIIAAQSYVGAAALMLVITALALARPARSVLPRGVWWLLVVAATLWISAIYFGGPVLAVLQRTGFLFSENFVGRARSILGFLVAVLAAVGFEVILRRRRAVPTGDRAERRAQLAYGIGVWVCFAGAAVGVYEAARHLATTENAGRGPGDPQLVSYLNGQVAVGVTMMLVTAAAIGWLWFAPRRPGHRRRVVRLTAAAIVPILVAGQGLAWVGSYYPRTNRENFYPTTPTQRFLAANLGHERYYGADGAIYGSVDAAMRLRALHGHGFLEGNLANLVDTLPGEQFTSPSTAIISSPAGGAAATSPMLDRSAVDYYVVSPEERPFGRIRTDPTSGANIAVRSGQSVTFSVPVTGPLRGVGVTPVSVGDANPTDARLSVTLHDSAGHVIASGYRTGAKLELGKAWIVPLAAESGRTGFPLTAQIVIHGATGLEFAAHGGHPAVSEITHADDGLELVYANETVIYHRLRALPRARWASTTQVVEDPDARLQLLGHRPLPADEVVLSQPGPAADGKPATVRWLTDGLTEMELSVRAEGAGYLVLADAIQNGWRVSLDGQPAALVQADHAFVAVPVPAGDHTVRFWYAAQSIGPGAWITGFTVLLLVVAAAGEVWWRRRRAPQ